MAKGKITNCIHDTFRPRSIGFGKTIPVNSKPTQDNFHVDRSRLGVHEEYDPEVPNDWGGKGKYVSKPNDIQMNALGAMGDILAKSSNAYECGPTDETGSGPCCIPSSPSPYGRRNPIYRKRG